jgi:hypothetical protein
MSFAATSSCSSAKPAHVLLQPAVSQEAPVAREDLGLREELLGSVLVGIAEDELAGLERRAGTGRGHVATSFDDRLRQPVAPPEVVVRVVEGRCRLQIERREQLDPRAPREELLVLRQAALPLGAVAGEQDRDGVQVRAGESTHPVVRVIAPGVAQHLRPGDHALLELLGKGGQGGLVHPQRA